MKKIILSVILVGVVAMVGWTVYDFVDDGDGNSEYGEVDGGVAITAPSSDDNEDAPAEQTDEVGIAKGNKAPDFKLETLDGETMQLSELEGQKVIVNFWATWCPPCREEIPHLQELYQNEDVEILAIDVTETESSVKDVEKFVNEDFEMDFPVLLDEESEVVNTYTVPAYPTSYMIDTKGHIQNIAYGAMEYDQMVQYIEEMD